MEVLKPNTQKLTINDAILDEAQNELNKIKEIEKIVDRENLVYRTNKYTYDFKNVRKINTFGIDNGKITLKEADKDQNSLLVEIMN